MVNTLTDKAKAKASHKRQEIRKQEIDLVLNWLRGDISLTQLTSVMFKSKKITTSTYVFVARAIKEAYKQGKLTIK